MEQYNVADLIKIASQQPLLEQEEEILLLKKWQEEGHDESIDILIKSHIRLVLSLIKQFHVNGLNREDLLQEGIVGLIHAANKFDFEKKVRFSTYAGYWSRSYMTDFVLKNWTQIRIGSTRKQKALFFAIRRKFDITDDRINYDTIKEVADEIGCSPEEVEQIMPRMKKSDISIDMRLQENGDSLSSILPSPDKSPEQNVIDHQITEFAYEKLFAAIAELPEREAYIIRKRRLSSESMTLADLGVKLELSKERIRQLEAKGVKSLRSRLEQYPEIYKVFFSSNLIQ